MSYGKLPFRNFELSDFKEVRLPNSHVFKKTCDMCHNQLCKSNQIFEYNEKTKKGNHSNVQHICSDCHYDIEDMYVW